MERRSVWRAFALYLHADRPLISQNGTSTPLHEMVHVASGLHGTGGADWIVEGLADYYSVELLRRSNTISQKRFDQSIETLAQWSAGTKCFATDHSEGTPHRPSGTCDARARSRDPDRDARPASRSTTWPVR